MKIFSSHQTNKGFTLIELLVVVAIITTLSVSVYVALKPGQRLIETKDARRTADLQSILTAIHQSLVDNRGTYPTGLSVGMSEMHIGTTNGGCAIVTGGCNVTGATQCINLMTGTGNLGAYLKTMPYDPQTGSASLTGYSVIVDGSGIVTLRSCGVEGSSNISVSR